MWIVDKMVLFITVICALLFINSSQSATTEAEESVKNAVMVEFYTMTINEWNDGRSGEFSKTLVSEASKYCEANLGECGFRFWNENFAFTTNEVVYIDKEGDYAYPYQEKSSMKIKIYLKFNAMVQAANVTNQTTYVLNRNALEDIIIEGRSVLKDAVGHSVIGIGAVVLTPEPDYLTNIIMCILALILLLVVVLIALGCWIYAEGERKKKETKIKKRFQDRKRQERLAKQYKQSPNKIAPTPEVRRSYKAKKRQEKYRPPEIREDDEEEEEEVEERKEPTVFTVEEPYHKRKHKKKSKKSKRHEETFHVKDPEPDTNITIVPMPDGASSFAYKPQTDDEDEDYDSAFHETNGHQSHHNQQQHERTVHVNPNKKKMTTDL